ncbi:hypothetical protein LJ656_09800 [Paraburkholderia sp. MMS20-SJTR3]|uniref:Uncharacterized protein n=1 Tax=Paraburkholderia sejongensis TaxID=2886946 RepID=A0ABS8JSM8_9BURK|nr:hypothetical protein [Paraburkholderia sp. MMS20-SJTR3]MCC8392882.1 hypothetical protein [Paraburkholderia sp. MMS20-SJTR3]
METKIINIEALRATSAPVPDLPAQFASLQPFASWALDTETARNVRRHAATMDEIRAFVAAMLPEMERIFAWLERFDMNALPPDARALMCLTLSLAEVAPAVEFYQQQAVVDGFDPRRFVADEAFVMSPAL